MKRAASNLSGTRLNHEPPAVTAKLGWRYHHIGIPHTQPRAREHHIAHLGVHVSGFETSPYGIEWIRFEPPCHVPEIVRTVPHIAFAVVSIPLAAAPLTDKIPSEVGSCIAEVRREFGSGH